MKPYRENVHMLDRHFPVRAWINVHNEHLSVHPHWHDEIEILYIKEGKVTQQINENIFIAVKGDIVFIFGNDIHSTYACGESTSEILVVQFNTDFIMPVYTVSPEKKMIENFRNGLDIPAAVKEDSDEGSGIINCLTEIVSEFDGRKDGFEILIKSWIYRIIGISSRSYKSRNTSRVNSYSMEKAREMLKKTFSLIDNNFGGEITLIKAAKISNLSVSHFCRLFKMATGMTFKEYLTFYRVNRAEELLATTRTITEIATECGFESLSSFIRNFKHYRNATPSAYRNRV